MEHPSGEDSTATARAHSNIALIKYWGKRDANLNLPAVGSISVTLDALHTETTVSFREDLSADEFWLSGERMPADRVTRMLDLVRDKARLPHGAIVRSSNNFPTGAGLASSASGFAALAVAACAAAGATASPRELSILARRGSGSAARSIFGGIAEMHAGTSTLGDDAFAEQLLAADEWPLAVVVAITDPSAKAISSTTGMAETAVSSPFYPAWVDTADDDLNAMRSAIDARDFQAVGELTEHSCLKLHSLMLTTRPALIYWNPGTMAAIHAVRRLRSDGVPVYFTIDAGPQVKALCLPEHADVVVAALKQVPGVQETRVTGLGSGAHTLTAGVR